MMNRIYQGTTGHTSDDGQGNTSRRTVLVVDDTLDNLSLLSGILKEYYTVKVANSGEKALRICSSDSPPDLVLLDIMMPVMDGYEVCRRLKSDPETRRIPVIFLTARTDSDDERRGLETGAVDYITKPVSPPIMLARIATHLALKGTEDLLRDKNAFLEQEVRNRTAEVWEAYQLNRGIIANAHEGIAVLDRELHYLVWNPFMEKLYGISAQDVIGRRPNDLNPVLKDDAALDQIRRALAGETVKGSEFPFTIAATGRAGWTLQSAAPLRDESGTVVGVICTISDISEQKAVEQQLRHSQKLEGIGQIAGGIAHDFNNILTVILGYGNILDMSGSLTDDQKQPLRHILNAAESASQLTRGLLAFSRKQEMVVKLADLNDIVRHFEKFLVRIIGEDIDVSILTGRMILPVLVDSGQIEQVLLNLATNARDAMPKGGRLTVETGVQEVDSSLHDISGFSESGRYAWLAVSDTGCGMDQSTRDRIFDPFFTTKEAGKGTGLGMAIVYGIVSQHNGAIHVDSQPGFGTTFRVYFPLIDADRIPPPAPKCRELPRGGSETILLAEDDEHVRMLIETLLTVSGYQVLMAVNGSDAVDCFRKNRQSISMVLMDMIMPVMDGIDSCHMIRAEAPDMPVLFLSGYTSDFLKHRGISDEKLEVVAKPVQPADLLCRIREILDGRMEQ